MKDEVMKLNIESVGVRVHVGALCYCLVMMMRRLTSAISASEILEKTIFNKLFHSFLLTK